MSVHLRPPVAVIGASCKRAVIIATLVVAAAACGERKGSPASERSPRGAATTTAAADSGCGGGPANVRATAPRPVAAVQLGAYGDSATAARVRDSLEREGWMPASVRRGAASGGRTVWRVRVAPTAERELAALFAAALRARGREAVVVADSAGEVMPTLRAVPVNRGSHGMAARVRWAQSADRCAVLVVEDPAAVENEPVPNGFVLASSAGGVLVQQDSAWDVAPAPDWRRVAYGRAYMLQAGGRDAVEPAQFEALARRVGLGADTVRRGSFEGSGMAVARGFAQPLVVDVSSSAAAAERTRGDVGRPLAMAGGWRVAWTAEGDLLVGTNPTHALDDSPAAGWLRIDVRGDSSSRATPADSALVARTARRVEWQEGPTLDISVPFDVAPLNNMPIADSDPTRPAAEQRHLELENRDGWMRITGRIEGGRRVPLPPRVIAPGYALAATRGGRYIVALVPVPKTREYEPAVRLVVYEVDSPERR